VEAASASLAGGVSGISALSKWAMVDGLKSHVAGLVGEVNAHEIPRLCRRTMGRLSVLAALAARQAVQDSQLEGEALSAPTTGVVLGSTMGSVETLDHFFGQYHRTHGVHEVEGTMFMRVMGHTVSANVAAMLGVRGPVLAVSSACTTSTQAIGLAYQMIGCGLADTMICGGADEVHPISTAVFDILGAASRRYNEAPSRTPRPFDRERDGVVLGEGAGVLVLEEMERARGRGAKIHGEIVGYATNCDSTHMTQPGTEMIEACMREALASARVEPRDLGYINAHATGTTIGDVAEARAIRALVGDAVPVSATKGYTGHMQAACGAVEVILTLIMMAEGLLRPTLNLEEVDPECGGVAHLQKPLASRAKLAMSSNFAFGGVNASLVLASV
jgi:3-oxoacyl-[acyl-carrier-protein] synthase II